MDDYNLIKKSEKEIMNDDKGQFMLDLIAMMKRATFDGDMSLPLSTRCSLATYLFSDTDEYRKLLEYIERELN